MTAYLNGEFQPLENCHIPADDRGFLLGDAVYEVIAVYHNRPFEVEKHLARLEHSLDACGIPNPHTRAQWREIFARLTSNEPADDFGLYLQVTRGSAPRDIAVPADATPLVFAMTMPHTAPVSAPAIKAVTREDFRWQRCDIKTTSLIAAVMLRRSAMGADCHDTIMVRDGKVTEATAANVFVVRNGELYTPPKSHRLLSGITRDVVIEIAAEHGIKVTEQWFGTDYLLSADEVWLTSSTKEITPVAEIDGHTIGDGAAYPLQHRFEEWLAVRAGDNAAGGD